LYKPLYLVLIVDNKRIVDEVASLHREIWRAQPKATRANLDPIKLLDPAIGAEILGISLRVVDSIDSGRRGFRTAGMLDRQQKSIFVSSQFRSYEMRFTAAHELGHAVLHTKQQLFRDRPIPSTEGERLRRPKPELEADIFAANYLMPPNLLREKFERTFRVTTPFVFDHDWAFHLCPSDQESLMMDEDLVMNRAYAIAKARSFNNRHFIPLHEQFGVSLSAMAYRIADLDFFNPHVDVGLASPKSNSATHKPLFEPGLHVIEERRLADLFVRPFSKSLRRRQLVESLQAFIAAFRDVPITCEIWLDGSFTTTKEEPGDLDIVVFIYPGQINRLSREAFEKLERLICIDLSSIQRTNLLRHSAVCG
jgi:Zn-dependent peptidase ImmA (M78 family)